MGIEFPVDGGALLTIAGAAVFASVVGQWLKSYLAEWRYTNLLVLALAEVAAVVAQIIAADGRPSAAAIYAAVLIGLFGATLATFGYETISNLLGKAGIGKRAGP
jgi:hypothetical protein